MSKRIVFQNEETGIAAIVCPAPGIDIEEEKAKLISRGQLTADCETVDAADVPSDRTFRNAWFHDKTPDPQKVGVEMTKAKEITHDRRRAKRSEEFKPLDIQATIPAEAVVAEAARQVIRDRYDAMQIAVDACATPEELKAIIDTEGI